MPESIRSDGPVYALVGGEWVELTDAVVPGTLSIRDGRVVLEDEV